MRVQKPPLMIKNKEDRAWKHFFLNVEKSAGTELTGSRLVATNASKVYVTIDDLTAYFGGGLGITVTDDLDGTVTIAIKQQDHISNASAAHSITDPADSPANADALRDDLVANAIPDIEAALDALGAKINLILTALETAEVLKTS